MNTIFGLCCQSELNPKLMASGTTTLKYLSKLGDKEKAKFLIAKAKSNISALAELLKFTSQNGIKAYRLSDSLVPMNDLGLFDMEK